MSDVNEHLSDQEASLMLYLAGELSPQERAEMDQRLAADPALRDSIEELRESLAHADQVMAGWDKVTAAPVPDGVAIRKISRMMKEWQSIHLQNVRQEASAEQTLRFPWWSYPLATAAAVALALFVWWTNLDHLDRQQRAFVPSAMWDQRIGRPIGPFIDIAAQDEFPFAEDLWADSLERSFDNTESLLEEAVATDHLDRAENEVLTLWDRRSDFPDALFIQDNDQ